MAIQPLVAFFLRRGIGRAIYTRFASPVSLRPRIQTLLPLDPQELLPHRRWMPAILPVQGSRLGRKWQLKFALCLTYLSKIRCRLWMHFYPLFEQPVVGQ